MATKTDKLGQLIGGNILANMGAGQAARPLNRAASPATPEAAGKLKGLVRSKDAAQIPLDRIERDATQPREEFDPESLERLAQSLKTRGQLQPIRVRWDEGRGVYVIVCGERRWRAARMAGMESVACVIHEGAIDVLAVQLIENALREDLKPVEQAKAFRALIETNGWEAKQLAAELAIDPGTVSRCLALLSLPESVQDQVEQGALAATTAYEVSRLADPAEQVMVAQVAVEHGLTRADVMEVVKARKAKRPAQARPEPVAVDLGDFTVTIRWRRAVATTAAEALRQALEQIQAA